MSMPTAIAVTATREPTGVARRRRRRAQPQGPDLGRPDPRSKAAGGSGGGLDGRSGLMAGSITISSLTRALEEGQSDPFRTCYHPAP